jgi:methyl-accepting chemotaxis protein
MLSITITIMISARTRKNILSENIAMIRCEIKKIVEVATQKANEGKQIANNMIEGYKNLNDNISSTINLISDIENASKEQLMGIIKIKRI